MTNIYQFWAYNHHMTNKLYGYITTTHIYCNCRFGLAKYCGEVVCLAPVNSRCNLCEFLISEDVT